MPLNPDAPNFVPFAFCCNSAVETAAEDADTESVTEQWELDELEAMEEWLEEMVELDEMEHDQMAALELR